MQSKTIKPSNLLEDELAKFSLEQRSLIYQHVSMIELTSGCTLFCDFCGVDAPKGVSDFIPFSLLEKIADEMATLTDRTKEPSGRIQRFPDKRDLLLYGATDPLDYTDGEKNYFDVLSLFESKGFKLVTSSAIPIGKEEIAIENLSRIDQISISHMNRKRLMPYFERLNIAVYVDVYNHLLASGKSDLHGSPHNYAVMVEGSVDETLDRIREDYPSLPKNARFYSLNIDGNMHRHKLLSQKETIFLYCANGEKNDWKSSKRIKDRDFEGVLNVGRAAKFDEEFRPITFASTNGAKITPKGIFNQIYVDPLPVSRKTVMSERIISDDFNIVRYARSEHDIQKIDWFYIMPKRY